MNTLRSRVRSPATSKRVHILFYCEALMRGSSEAEDPRRGEAATMRRCDPITRARTAHRDRAAHSEAAHRDRTCPRRTLLAAHTEPYTPSHILLSRTPSTSSTPSTGPHTFNRFTKKNDVFHPFCSKTRSNTRFCKKFKEESPLIFQRSIQKHKYLFKIRSNKLQI